MAQLFSATAFGFHADTIWSKTVLTPGGYGLVEFEPSETATVEKGLALTEILSSFLQRQHSLATIRSFLSSPAVQEVHSLLLIIQDQDQVFIAIHGKGTIFLVRNNKCIPLMQKAGVLKGKIQETDRIVAVSGAVSVSHEALQSVLDNQMPVKHVVESLEMLFGQEVSAGGGIIFEHNSEPVIDPMKHLKPVRKFPTIQVDRKKIVNLYDTRQKKIRLMTITIGLIFLVTVVLGIRKQQSNSQSLGMEKVYTEATELFNQALASMDRQKDVSKEQLQKAKGLIVALSVEPLPKGKLARDLQELEAKIDDNLKIVTKVFSVELAEYFNASLLREGRVIDAFTRVGDTIFFLDKQAPLLGAIAIPTKNSDIITASSLLQGAKSLAGERETVYVLTDKDVVKISPKSTEPQSVGLALDSIQSPDLLAAFGLNLYVIDKQQGVVWRIPGDELGKFGKPQRYFAEDFTPDLTQVTSVQIDGSVWFGTTTGKILKYTQGASEAFVPRGLDLPLGTELVVYTSELTNYCYILDRDNKRIVVLTKEGLYQGQYMWKESIVPTDLVVSEQQNRVVLLANKELYSFSLQ